MESQLTPPRVLTFEGELDAERATIMMELASEAGPGPVVLDLGRAAEIGDAAIAVIFMSMRMQHRRVEVRGLPATQRRLLDSLLAGAAPEPPGEPGQGGVPRTDPRSP